jgi:UDPglucose--hexose-1-phosphate uridylyltransferase
MRESKKFWKRNKKCVFCSIIQKERNGQRLILENSKFLVFTPYASVNPLEFWIFPKKHEATLLKMSKNEVETFAETLKTCLKGLKDLSERPAIQLWFSLSHKQKCTKILSLAFRSLSAIGYLGWVRKKHWSIRKYRYARSRCGKP